MNYPCFLLGNDHLNHISLSYYRINIIKLTYFFGIPRWSVTTSDDYSTPLGNIEEAELKETNSARVSCIHNERVTAPDHFQVESPVNYHIHRFIRE